MATRTVPRADVQHVATMLRQIADKLEAGEVYRWEYAIECVLQERFSRDGSGVADTGRRRIEFECEV